MLFNCGILFVLLNKMAIANLLVSIITLLLVITTSIAIPLILYYRRKSKLSDLFISGYLPHERAHLDKWEFKRDIVVGEQTSILVGLMFN